MGQYRGLVAALLVAVGLAAPADLNSYSSSFGIPGNASYDYVVVGGGTAGNTIAYRLAQNGSFSVAIIEAGSFYETSNGNYSVVPSGATYFTGADPTDVNPLVDWGIVTTPQATNADFIMHEANVSAAGTQLNLLAAPVRQSINALADLISSGRNYFLYQRGTRESYAMWADAVGDASYSFDRFLPYFERSVNFTQANNALRFTNASYTYNGPNLRRGGPLHVTIPNYADAFATWLLQAFPKIGLPITNNFVDGKLMGVNYGMVTLDPNDMTRSSSETSFMRAAVQNTQLQIYSNSLAEKILFNGTSATGVSVNSGGLHYVLTAKKEVILSAGVFQSPQLLMLSGIGSVTTLEQHGVQVVADRPGVGQNMWDHIFFGPTYKVALITHSALGDADFAAQATQEYIENSTGLVGVAGGDIIGWEKLPDRAGLSETARQELEVFPSDWPEVEYLMLDGYQGDNQNYVTGTPRTKDMYASPAAALVAPLSRGNVTLSSALPGDLPVVNPNWLTHPTDQEVGIAAWKRLLQLMSTDTMRNITIGSQVYPASNATTDAEILEVIKKTAITVYHASGTCKMGRENDTTAVVDPSARVYGVSNLRVVDSSAFPFLPPGHPQSTVYAFAEKIADDILNRAV